MDMPRESESKRTGLAAAALLAAVCLCAAAADSRAARIYPSAGTTSAAFLKIGVGARPSAMAGAYTALSDDAYAVYWNPAGLALGPGKTLVFTHNDYFQGLGQEYFGFTLPGEETGLFKSGPLARGTLGLGLDYFYTPKDMERRSGLNEADPLVPISPVEGKFSAYDMAFSAAYGFSYGQDLRLGAALKFIRQSIDNEAGNTVALDLGALCDFNWLDRQFTAGFAVQNFGPGIKFVSRSFDLPLTFRAGISHRIYQKGLLLSADLVKPIDNYPSLAVGLEHPLPGGLALRTGYRYRQHGNELGAWSGFSAGLGFVYDQFSFDYAFSPFGDLGSAHRVSLAFRFGVPPKAAPKPPTGAEPAAERVEGATLNYEVTRRPVKISNLSAEFAVKAVSGQAALSAMEFRTRQRGGAEQRLEVLEGALPPGLRSSLPKGFTPLAAWQLGSGFAGVSGDISMTFRFLEPAVNYGEPWLFYMTSSGWRRVPAEKGGCDGGVCELTGAVPLSSHYALAVKN